MAMQLQCAGQESKLHNLLSEAARAKDEVRLIFVVAMNCIDDVYN